MKTIITALAASTFLWIGVFENQLNIVPRYYNGTIESDVREVQGEKTVQQQSLSKNYELLKAALERRVERNMFAIRKHVTCYETPENCSQGFNW